MKHATSGAIVAGWDLPAMSISWEPPISAIDSGFCVIFSEVDPNELRDDHQTQSEFVCMHSLIEHADPQLGQGLDLARKFGQVDWDPDTEEWFVPGHDPDRVMPIAQPD